MLERTGLPPDYLELELTESVLAREADRAVELVGRLHDLGVTLSMDDFGSGYSSLSYLRQFRVHLLKIDRSFVAGMLGNPSVHSVVEATISLARALQIRVVAEGVETREQSDALEHLGCDEIQGYLVSAPMEAGDFERWTAARGAPTPVGS